jgi:hypothetical protein
MGRDREQPGRKRPLAIIAMKMLVGPQERLLRGIFSRFGLTQHAITQVVDRGLIGLNNVCKRFVASVFSLEYPGLFLVHVAPLDFSALTLRSRTIKGCRIKLTNLQGIDKG